MLKCPQIKIIKSFIKIFIKLRFPPKCRFIYFFLYININVCNKIKSLENNIKYAN